MLNSAVVLALVASVCLASPAADVVNIPITGKIVSSRNVTNFFPNVPVNLYNSDKDNNKLDLVQTTTSSAAGDYTFTVPHSRRYQVCALINGMEACVHRSVPDVSGGGSNNNRQRRLTTLASLNIPVPLWLGPSDFEIQTIWTMDYVGYQCDWDNVLAVPFKNAGASLNCVCGIKDTNSMGYCCDPASSYCERNALAYQDSSCSNSAFGFEAIGLTEPNTGSYKHFVYAYGTGNSFDTVSAASQGQINLYRRGILGIPYLEKTILLSNAISDNVNARFWHTFTLNVNSGAFGSAVETSRVTCTPTLSVGSSATLSLEHGARGC